MSHPAQFEIWPIVASSGSLRGVYVTPGPIWNLAHSGPCECYEILWRV
jgi:hypothetical protein